MMLMRQQSAKVPASIMPPQRSPSFSEKSANAQGTSEMMSGGMNSQRE